MPYGKNPPTPYILVTLAVELKFLKWVREHYFVVIYIKITRRVMYFNKTGSCTYLNSAVAFIRTSSLICQLEMCPLMNPEMITNSSTRMLIAVKILLIVVDSFTPNASTPSWKTCRMFILCVYV